MNNIEFIGESIRILRTGKGLSQEQLALNAGVNTSYIGQIERGEKNPTIKTLEKIAVALKVSLLDLLLYSNPKKGVSNQSIQILTPARIKQCLLEVLLEHTDLVTMNVLKSYRNFEE
ncbi:helix-turn-helix transcriptional regulator [Paenibacillus sp. FSL E2-0202]|uniref:helix-turn-helix domain-containing protein n=1 Tax=unclassified Paenibacillus TaxID=185978 RepID=UPI0030EB2010